MTRVCGNVGLSGAEDVGVGGEEVEDRGVVRYGKETVPRGRRAAGTNAVSRVFGRRSRCWNPG